MDSTEIPINEFRELVELVSENMSSLFGEPMPNFEHRRAHILESCLAQPFQSFEGDLYPTVFNKAAAHLYFIIKNHPFVNGNKRCAMIAMMLYLVRNDRMINIGPVKLYETAVMIAHSSASDRESIIAHVSELIEANSISRDAWMKENRA